MNFCTRDLKDPELVEEARKDKVKRVVKTYKRFKNDSNYYAMKFFLFEIVNLSNSIMQLYFTNRFMGYRFMDYGRRVFHYYYNMDKSGDELQVWKAM